MSDVPSRRRGWGEPPTRSWNDGYVVDTPYTEPVAPDLSTAWLSMVAVLHGQPPLDVSRPFTWIDLGCGSGLPACAVAATNANAEVWGFDFNPAHVERARDVATRAGLTNCTFVEASFADLAADSRLGPAEADVIVVHGVFSWVSPENQRHIVECIRRLLRPGGYAVVMYEVATGWSAMVPVAEAMRLVAEASGQPGHGAFGEAVAAMHGLATTGARVFPLPPREADQFTKMRDAHPLYGAHEYLGSHFAPLVFADVASLMHDARCAYVGSLEATDHTVAFWVPPDLTELVTGSAGVTLREMLRDLATQRMLRRDVWRRGPAVAAHLRREEWLHDLRVVGLGKAYEDGAGVPVPVGDAALDAAYHRPLVDALARGPLGVYGIREIHPGWGEGDAMAALGLLVAGGYATPVLRAWAAHAPAHSPARRLNEVLVAENELGADHTWLASPAVGGPVAVDFVDVVTLGALWTGVAKDTDALAEHAWRLVRRYRREVKEAGEVVTDEATARAVVRDKVEAALGATAGPLAQLGIA